MSPQEKADRLADALGVSKAPAGPPPAPQAEPADPLGELVKGLGQTASFLASGSAARTLPPLPALPAPVPLPPGRTVQMGLEANPGLGGIGRR